jgi:hypothetical protein
MAGDHHVPGLAGHSRTFKMPWASTERLIVRTVQDDSRQRDARDR